MEEHHQLRGDEESHRRNTTTQSRSTPRDSSLPPLDWHVYFPNVAYDVTSDRRCELASKLIDAFCLTANAAELFDQVIIIVFLRCLRDETKGNLSLSFSLASGVFSRDVNDDNLSLSFSLILRFSKAETTALSLSLSAINYHFAMLTLYISFHLSNKKRL